MIKAVVFDYGAVINRRLRIQKQILNLAAELRASGIKTAVLSNMIPPMAWAVKRRSAIKGFEPRVFSCDIGLRKPDAGTYEYVIKELGLKPSECLFIDNRAENVSGAKAVGMQALQAHNTPQTVADIRTALKA